MVALGGAFGAALRYAAILAIKQIQTTFPWPVFAVNITGSFFIGIMAGLASRQPNNTLNLLLSVGILGGFTTFSSFSLDNLTLIKNGQPLMALLNILAQCTIGILAAWAGYALTFKPA